MKYVYILTHSWGYNLGECAQEVKYYSSEELLTADYCLEEEKFGLYVAERQPLNVSGSPETLWRERFTEPNWALEPEDISGENFIPDPPQESIEEVFESLEEELFYDEWGEACEWLFHNRSNEPSHMEELSMVKKELLEELNDPTQGSRHIKIVLLQQVERKIQEINRRLLTL